MSVLQGNTLSTPVQPGIWRKGPDGAPGPATPLEWEPSGPTSVPPSLTPTVERMLKVDNNSVKKQVHNLPRLLSKFLTSLPEMAYKPTTHNHLGLNQDYAVYSYLVHCHVASIVNLPFLYSLQGNLRQYYYPEMATLH